MHDEIVGNETHNRRKAKISFSRFHSKVFSLYLCLYFVYTVEAGIIHQS